MGIGRCQRRQGRQTAVHSIPVSIPILYDHTATWFNTFYPPLTMSLFNSISRGEGGENWDVTKITLDYNKRYLIIYIRVRLC